MKPPTLPIGRLASDIWHRDQYFALLVHLHGDAPPDCFGFSLLGKPDGYGMRDAIFKHNSTRSIRDAIPSTWRSLTGEASEPYSIVLLPRQNSFRSTWCVWDFDFHKDPEDSYASHMHRNLLVFIQAAEKLADEAIGYLVEHSGNGWHCWLIAANPLPEKQWRRIRKRVESEADFTAAPEFLPCFKGKGKGCRAPGSSNPKTWHPGREDWRSNLIFWQSLPPQLELKNKDAFFSSNGNPELPNPEPGEGGTAIEALTAKWAITAAQTRNNQLAGLIGEGCYHFGKAVLHDAAITLYQKAAPPCRTALEEHLEEFETAHARAMETLVLPRLSLREREVFHSLSNQSEREVFIIAHNHARFREDRKFFCSTLRIGRSIGMSFQQIANIRNRFCDLGIMERLPGRYIPGKRAHWFRWLLPMLADEYVPESARQRIQAAATLNMVQNL